MRISTKLFVSIVIVLSAVILSTNLAQGQFEWEKYEGNPILSVGSPGAWNSLYISSPSIFFDGNLYHLWYQGSDDNSYRVSIGYATSSDGINWIEYANNPVFSGSGGEKWDAHNIGSPNVIFDGSIFHMWYTGGRQDTNGKPGIGYATSLDGISWESYSGNPVLTSTSANWDEWMVVQPTVLKVDSIFYMWFSGLSSNNVHSIGFATSQDGITWVEYEGNPILTPEKNIMNAIVEPCHILFQDGCFKMWFDYGYNGLQQIGYAKSLDGINWTFYEGNPILDKSGPEEWDNGSVFLCAVYFNDNKYHMWYSGGDGTFKSDIGYATCSPKDHDLIIASAFNSLSKVPLWSKSSFKPKAKIGNNGLSDEFNFIINCTIDSAGIPIHHETIAVDSFKGLSLKFKEISFQEWNFNPVEECIYDVCYFTVLTSDQNTLNDTMRTTVEASNLIDDFELGVDNWQSNSTWGVNTQFANSGKYSLNDSPNTSYQSNVDNWIEYSHNFDLSKLDGAHITFWTKYFIEKDKDWGYFEVSSDDGTIWKQLGEAFTGIEINWKNVALDLSNYCGSGMEDIRLRFRIVTDATTNLPGWFIDDVTIHEGTIISSTQQQIDTQIPDQYVLMENYPNPFNAQTIIRYHLPEAGRVNLTIYNLSGQRIITLIDKFQQAGSHQFIWNGNNQLNKIVPSGLYFYQIEINNFVDVKKMLLLK